MVTQTNPDPPITYVYQKRYMKELDISVVLCEELAPNFNGIYISLSIYVIGNCTGGSRGIAWRTYIYGMFKIKNDRKFIIPLKSWCGYSKVDTLELRNQWNSAQRDCIKGAIEYMKTGKCIID